MSGKISRRLSRRRLASFFSQLVLSEGYFAPVLNRTSPEIALVTISFAALKDNGMSVNVSSS